MTGRLKRILQALEGDVQMHFALAVEQQLVGVGIVAEAERGIVLAELRQRRGELHLVVAVLDVDREAEERLQRFRPFVVAGRLAAGAQQIAGLA